jgi:hypothetical protein
MFWWKTLQRKVDSFPLWFYEWRDALPLVIAKATKPLCFKNVDINSPLTAKLTET